MRWARVSRLAARLLETDDKGAKAAMLTLNRAGSRACELEEAWIVFALVREDELAQVEVAELLGRTPSWVCRRLALIEKLGEEAKEDLRLGLLSATSARHVARLPRGNQPAVLDLIRREALSVRELRRSRRPPARRTARRATALHPRRSAGGAAAGPRRSPRPAATLA